MSTTTLTAADFEETVLRDGITLVDFWASWCGPCRASFPWMAKLAAAHASDSLVVIAIDLDKERALADAFLEQHPAAFDIAFDPAGKTAEAFQVSAMPTSFLIGRDGTILWRHAGFDPRQAAGLESRVTEALRR
jgi:thiol-disulfide isomerase/thioredoxin